MSDRDGDWALYAMEATGGNEHRVLPAGSVDPFGSGLGIGEPVVSPDGRRVVLPRRGITVVTLETGASQRIGRGEESSAAWSPDGTRIAYSGHGNTGLYVADVRTGRKRALLRKSQTWMPAWSPDGKWIAFVRQIGYGPDELYALHPDGTGLKRLTGYAPGGSGALAWSRDGTLAFVGLRGNGEVAHLVLVDGATSRVDVLPRRLGDGTVAWSPDGRRMAVVATTVRSDEPVLYIADAHGNGRRRLTPSEPEYYDQSPVWSPDGESLLVVRSRAGGGAEREAPEVWTIRADGSQQHPLTKAFPDGGENVDPAWISGPVRTEAPARPREARRGRTVVLQVPFSVNGISAEGARAAIAPVAYEEQRGFHPTPPVLVWRPGHGEPRRLVASPCGGIEQLVLTGDRLAFDCNDIFLDLIAQSARVFDLRTGVPREVFSGRGGGPDLRGLFLDYIVGGSGLLAFGTERDDRRGNAIRRTLWRIDGLERTRLRSGPEIGDVIAAGRDRLAVELTDGRVEILRANGSVVRVLPLQHHRPARFVPFGTDPKPALLLAGRALLVLEHKTLMAYDSVTGKLRWHRAVPRGAQLEAADGGLVVYTAGSSIHLVSRGRDKVMHTGAERLHRGYVERILHAALTPKGLYYCFNVAGARYPGRVVFLPRRALPQ